MPVFFFAPHTAGGQALGQFVTKPFKKQDPENIFLHRNALLLTPHILVL